MTLAHINIQAFPRDKRKHFLLYFQRLSSCLSSSIPFICFHCVHWMCRGETSMGGSLRLEMLCVATLPSPRLFLTSPNMSSEMKRTKCWQKIKFAEWQEILARLHSSRFHRSVSEEAQPKLNRCIQMIVYSLLRWKDVLELAEEPQRHLSALWSFTVAFELYLACVIKGRTHTHKAMLLFWRDGRGGGAALIGWTWVIRQRSSATRGGMPLRGLRVKISPYIRGANGITKTTVHSRLWKPTLFGNRMGQ